MYKYLEAVEKQVYKDIEDGLYEKALSGINTYASYAYDFNQFYTNENIENAIIDIEHRLNFPDNLKKAVEKNVLYYDGFWNVDTRGLTLIYLEALFDLGFNVYYVTNEAAKGKKPVTEKLIKERNGKIVYITEPLNNHINQFKALCKIFEYIEPKHAFFYAYPFDVSGAMAFNRYEKHGVKRYQIDLTDHAYWLGVNSFDYCLESRNFGINLAYYERKIPIEKIAYGTWSYPVSLGDTPFMGYPFEKNEGDFIIFSGGSSYKTIDKNKTYYKIVKVLLDKFSQVKFWYAGDVIQEDMRSLLSDYPNRVFFTRERKDLVPILENIDLFLNTYPLIGGLMFQYSAMSGKSPYTLILDDSTKGLLMDDENLDIYFKSVEDMIEDIDKYISDSDYRNKKNNNIINKASTRELFLNSLKDLMIYGKSKKIDKVRKCNADNFKKIYYDRCKIKYNF